MYRFDNSKKYIWKTIILNNRLNSYKKYLVYYKKLGYIICNMEDFYNYRYEKCLVLRHDVDWRTPATRKMYELELQLGVKSTYYFRKTTIDKQLIGEMLENGFEVGFHYETIAEYVRENNLHSLSEEDIDKCKTKLKEEIQWFNNEINSKISSICSHGAPENRIIGVSNNILLENDKYTDYNIGFEAYDRELYNSYIDEHIMDCNIRYNYGFAYKSNPIDAANNSINRIILLTHPNHWYETPKDWIKNTVGLIIAKSSYNISERKFNRIMNDKLKVTAK